jgi:predicted RNase H-like HicB family nuclease
MATTTGHEGRAEKGFGLREVSHCPGCGAPMIVSPVLKSVDCDEIVYLRSFYYKRGEGYAAECIDLDLLSLGATPEEAIGSLQEAMFGYLEVAFEGDPKGLVMRRSPLTRRIHYHWRVLIRRIKHLFETNHQEIALSSRTYTLCE